MGESLAERRRVVDEVLRDVNTFYWGEIPHLEWHCAHVFRGAMS